MEIMALVMACARMIFEVPTGTINYLVEPVMIRFRGMKAMINSMVVPGQILWLVEME